jgi:hypothetical protein
MGALYAEPSGYDHTQGDQGGVVGLCCCIPQLVYACATVAEVPAREWVYVNGVCYNKVRYES